jgi:putative membrane protein
MERSNRNLWIGLGALAVLLLAVLPSMGGGMMFGAGPAGFGSYGMRGFFGMPFMWGFWGLGLVARVLFFGLIVFLMVRLFRRRAYDRYRDETPPTDLPADEILRRRYAAGEISREQFEEMRQTLHPSTT